MKTRRGVIFFHQARKITLYEFIQFRKDKNGVQKDF
jgi:hypothetical protein